MSERENLLRAVRQKHDAHHDSQNRNPPGLIRTVAHEIPPEPFSFVEWLTPGNTQRAGRALCLQERGTLRLLNGKASTFQPTLVSANVFVAQLRQFLRRHSSLRTRQAAAVYYALPILLVEIVFTATSVAVGYSCLVLLFEAYITDVVITTKLLFRLPRRRQQLDQDP